MQVAGTLMACVCEGADVLREKVRQKCRTPDGETKLLRQTFKFFDTDETGSVTIDEFGRAMERLGCVLWHTLFQLAFGWWWLDLGVRACVRACACVSQHSPATQGNAGVLPAV